MSDADICRAIGLHLPRRIEAHPSNPNLTLETCLRCWALIERSRSLGVEIVMPWRGRIQVPPGEVLAP